MRSFRGFLDARGFDVAAGVAFESLLSFVPLAAAITVLTVTLFGDPAHGFYRLLRAFLPGASREVLRELQEMADRAMSVSSWAALFFLLTSVRVFWQVESAVSAMWGSTRTRPAVRQVSLGLVVVLLGPVLAGIVTSVLLETGASFLELRFSTLVAAMGALTLLYRFVPRAHVRWFPAAVAGAFAGLGLTLVRWGLTRGVSALRGLTEVYGGIAFAFVFVFATGIAWTVLLFGVSLAHSVQFRHELLVQEETEPPRPPGVLDETVSLLLALADRWRAGVPSTPVSEACAETGIGEGEAKARLKRLAAAGLVESPVDGSWRLTRSPDEISLYAAARAVGEATPRPVPTGGDETSELLRRLYRRADREERAVLQGTSLRDIWRPQKDRPLVVTPTPESAPRPVGGVS